MAIIAIWFRDPDHFNDAEFDVDVIDDSGADSDFEDATPAATEEDSDFAPTRESFVGIKFMGSVSRDPGHAVTIDGPYFDPLAENVLGLMKPVYGEDIERIADDLREVREAVDDDDPTLEHLVARLAALVGANKLVIRDSFANDDLAHFIPDDHAVMAHFHALVDEWLKRWPSIK